MSDESQIQETNETPQTEGETRTVTEGENPPASTSETPKTEEKKNTRQMSFTVLENGEIRADFGEGVEPVLLNPASVPEALQAAAVVEGLISRLRGYTSKLVDDKRTPVALRAAVATGVENLLKGIWKIERGEGTGSEISIEAEAAHVFRVMRAAAKGETFTGTLEESAANFGALSDEKKKEIKALPRYQLALAQVKAKRQAEKAAKLEKKLAEGEDDAGF